MKIKKPSNLKELRDWYHNYCQSFKKVNMPFSLYYNYEPDCSFSNKFFEIVKDANSGLYVISKFHKDGSSSAIFYTSNLKEAVAVVYDKLRYSIYFEMVKYNPNLGKNNKIFKDRSYVIEEIKYPKAVLIIGCLFIVLNFFVGVFFIKFGRTQIPNKPTEYISNIQNVGYYYFDNDERVYYHDFEDKVNSTGSKWYVYIRNEGWIYTDELKEYYNKNKMVFISSEFDDFVKKYEVEEFRKDLIG